MTELTAFVGVLLAVSLAVERVLELLKKSFRLLTKKDETPAKPGSGDATEVFTLVLGAVIGTVIAWQAKPEIVAALPKQFADQIGWGTYVVVGILTSGGSKFWNQVLDILYAAKVKREAIANDVRALQQQKPGDVARAFAAFAK